MWHPARASASFIGMQEALREAGFDIVPSRAMAEAIERCDALTFRIWSALGSNRDGSKDVAEEAEAQQSQPTTSAARIAREDLGRDPRSLTVSISLESREAMAEGGLEDISLSFAARPRPGTNWDQETPLPSPVRISGEGSGAGHRTPWQPDSGTAPCRWETGSDSTS